MAGDRATERQRRGMLGGKPSIVGGVASLSAVGESVGVKGGAAAACHCNLQLPQTRGGNCGTNNGNNNGNGNLKKFCN